MTAATLTAERLRELLHYEPASGVFTWRVRKAIRVAIGQEAGTLKDGYRRINIDGHLHYAHRLAWLYMHGEWPTGLIDHRLGVRDDNRMSEIRDASPGINSENQRRARRDNKSCGLLGVSLQKSTGAWTARLVVRGHTHYLGDHPTPELAHAAYVQAKRRLHSGNTL